VVEGVGAKDTEDITVIITGDRDKALTVAARKAAAADKAKVLVRDSPTK
jgi:hypothetical protein